MIRPSVRGGATIGENRRIRIPSGSGSITVQFETNFSGQLPCLSLNVEKPTAESENILVDSFLATDLECTAYFNGQTQSTAYYLHLKASKVSKSSAPPPLRLFNFGDPSVFWSDASLTFSE